MSFVDTFVIGLIFLAGRNVTYPQNSQVVDSGNSLKIQSNEINYTKISTPPKLGSYYLTDSIFSFRSPKGYFPSLLHNFGEQATAPLHFKTKQWLMTGAVVGITAALVHFDNDIDDWARFQKQNHNWVNKTSPFITSFGSNTGILSVIGFGSISAVFKNEKGVQTSLLATQAMITSGVWVRLIKILSGRERPSAAYYFSKSEGGKWYGPLAQFDQDLALRKPGSSFDSFISGHTATAFSIATVFALQYKDIKAVPIISYTAASLVGISRLTEHAHWASDV
ncbi:MAG TPA: phosphatase PAP2 family protein, partial [Ignavibacteriaceae bacterium]|nr:phosphatase PAP2 family protein [Ignavibacteriaceae bacterium]